MKELKRELQLKNMDKANNLLLSLARRFGDEAVGAEWVKDVGLCRLIEAIQKILLNLELDGATLNELNEMIANA